MKKQDRYSKAIFIITLLIIIVVVVRSSSADSFRQGAELSALPALVENNFLIPEEVEKLESGTLLVLDNSDVNLKNQSLERIYFSLDNAGSRDFLKSVRKSPLPVVIVANSPNLESKLWMLLAQAGIKDLMVCSESEDETVLKYEFRPDTEVSK
jgi:hypothetical protein